MKTPAFVIAAFFPFICCSAAPPTLSSFTPVNACIGTTITITGTNFTGVSDVTFGGSSASSFIVVSATSITAVVAAGSSGSVQVITVGGSPSKTGFTFVPSTTPAIITDFKGFWASVAGSPNAVVPDTSHTLLAFTYNGTTYSTGVNDPVLNSHSVTFTAGSYRALPVAGITGVTAATSTYLALAKKVDGSATVAYTPAVSGFSIKSALTDGINGLNLGTGVTNLPATAILTFPIFNIDPSMISDNEPDILITQIAQPVAGNDIFSFIDASGTIVGTTLTQDMTFLPKFGTYDLDLFNLSPLTPYNSATAYSAFSTNTNRDIRLVGFRLSDFNITPANVGQVKSFRITPSGNSDYAFIAYNANAINLPPNITVNDAATNATICAGGTANLSVVGAAAMNGILTYSWEESMDAGTTWHPISNGGSYSGAATNKLTIVNATDNYKYRATIQEAGNPASSVSTTFSILVSVPAAPSSVTIGTTTSTCLNTPIQLTSTVVGGSNLNYQWQSNASGSYQNISNANINTYIPPVSQTGNISYQLIVSSGSNCPSGITSSSATITVTGISSVTPASICNNGSLVLNATATSGSVDWYVADAGGSSLITNTTYTTPVLSSTTTYYVAASGCVSAFRAPVIATIYPLSGGGAISGNTTVTTGNNSATLTLSGITGNVIRWQSSTDNFNTIVNDITNTTLSLTVTDLTQTTNYRAVVQSGTCSLANSASATITVNGVLPINNTTLRAVKHNDGIELLWSAYNLENTDAFEIEHSEDGNNFSVVNRILVSAIGDKDYAWKDYQPFRGKNFYRIREVLKTGGGIYSSTIRLIFENSLTGISVYPNPVTNPNVLLELNEMHSGIYQFNLVNNMGQLIFHRLLEHAGGTTTQSLILPSAIPPGIYYVQVIGSPGKPISFKLIITNN